jgi:ABC-type multidrug transport system fused ATPase/permease subunit
MYNRSGSGKSSLLKATVGIAREELVNSFSIFYRGYDVSDYDRNNIFAYVSQDIDLFNTLTIAENIAYNHPQVHLSALEAALKDSCSDEIVSRLDRGSHSLVSSRSDLSGGERQRLSIARALYRQQVLGSILLLDEATSQLDSFTEMRIMNTIYDRVHRKNATAIIVAHRLSSLNRCDRILVVDGGRVVESGTHHELMNNASGWYAQAWKLQATVNEK